MKNIFSLILLSILIFSQNIQNISAEESNNSSKFSDVSIHHENYSAINNLYRRWIIWWYSDWNFKPENNLNRVEALKILLLSASIWISEDAWNVLSFKDTQKDSWYFKYIATAQSLWIVNWYSDWNFRPWSTVNLAESLKMLLESNSVNYKKNVFEAPYYDVPKTAWFAWYFDYAKENNLLDWPKNWKINPWKNINRAEFSEIIYRFLENKKEVSQNTKLAIPYFKNAEWTETKSWEIYKSWILTAWISKYNFWANLLITNIDTWDSVIVKVNDEWPEMQDKEIKLSQKAFDSIANWKNKILNVKIEEVKYQENIPDEVFQKTDSCNFPTNRWKIKKDFFDNINLFNEIETNFRENEIYNIAWKLENWSKDVLVFIKNSDWSKTRFLWDVWSDWFFSLDIELWQKWEKQIWIIAWNSGSSYLWNIEVYENNCEKNFKQQFDTKPENLSFKIKNNNTYLKWTWTWDIARVILMQGENKVVKFLNKEDNYIKLNPVWFRDFSEWEIMWQVWLTSSLSWNIFDQDTWWNISETQKTQITKHYYSENKTDQLEIFNLEPTFIFWWEIKIAWRIKSEIRTNAEIILPNWMVEEIKINSDKQKIKNSNWVEIFPVLSKFNFNFTPKENWTHIVEVNHVSWIAVLNYPIYEEWFMPILPDFKDLSQYSWEELNINIKNFQAEMLWMINKDRTALWLNRLILIPELSILWQDKANDMSKNNYISHWDKNWKTLNDLRFSYWIKMWVWENISVSQNLEFSHLWLMRSAAHRANILNKDWSRIWFWFAKWQNWELITTQVFSSSPLLESNIDEMRLDFVDEINKKRSDFLLPNTILHAISQNWVDKMVEENFFNFTNEKNWITESLNDSIKSAWIKTTVWSFMMANTSYKWLFEELVKHERVFDNVWKKIWIWIKQWDDWVMKMLLIYTY
jgi:rare lipoprotein A (peptidoglycan hydrolase)